MDEIHKIASITIFHIASNGLLSKKEEISDFLKLTHFSPQKAKNRFFLAIIARKNDQSSFLCNSEPSNANTEVLRLKQVTYIKFIGYFLNFLYNILRPFDSQV